MDKFLPSDWGLKMPVNFNHLYNISSPKFYPSSDILSGDINSAPNEIKTKNNQSSISTSFNKVTKSDNLLIKYTLDQISLNFSIVNRNKSTATIEKEIAQDISISGNYGYNFSDSNFILPFKFLILYHLLEIIYLKQGFIGYQKNSQLLLIYLSIIR